MGLNDTIDDVASAGQCATPVLRNLAAPKTGLRQLFVALDRPAAEAARWPPTTGRFFSDLDTFFTAWAGVAPSSARRSTAGRRRSSRRPIRCRYEAAFVKRARFMRLLRPSAGALRTVAAPLGHAFAEGAVNLQRGHGVQHAVGEASLQALLFANNPVVTLGLEDIAQTAQVGNPLVAGLRRRRRPATT